MIIALRDIIVPCAFICTCEVSPIKTKWDVEFILSPSPRSPFKDGVGFVSTSTGRLIFKTLTIDILFQGVWILDFICANWISGVCVWGGIQSSYYEAYFIVSFDFHGGRDKH